MGWEDRGWVPVDEQPVADLAEGALDIFQQSKLQTLTIFHSAMGMFILTSTSRVHYPKIATPLIIPTPHLLFRGAESHLEGVR